MNLLAMLAGLLPWAATPVSAFTRIYLACSLLSLEAQVITWLGRGTLDSLFPLNLLLAIVAAVWQIRAKRETWTWVGTTRRALPIPIVLAMLAVVIGLNLWRPVMAADTYQLDRMHQIEGVGSLVYSTDITPKANIVAAFYELVLADLQSVPVAGDWLVRFHGVLGLFLFSLSVAAAQSFLPIDDSFVSRALIFTVPVVFHQLVLIKNDLFVGAPAFVVLAWAVGGARNVTPNVRGSVGPNVGPNVGRNFSSAEVFWAGWLAGLVVAAKLTSLAVALVIGASVYLRQRNWRPLVITGVAGVAGLVAGGLALTFWQNARVYGDIFAAQQVDSMGSVNRSVGAAVVGLVRFIISLFDMSLVTREVWPNRGGWGGPFGLPLLWALAVLIASWRTAPDARRALAAGGLCLLAFGISFADADLSHRLVLGPGLLLVAAGASAYRTLNSTWAAKTLPVVVILSSAQILRSAVLYISQP